MNDPMRILKADHREVEKLLKKLADSDEGTERQELFDELETKLSLHMELEETLVYPLVREHLGEEDEEEADIEHQLARDGLAKMRELLEAPGFGAAVEMVMGGIRHHVEEEENELLPDLKDELERDEWIKIGDEIAAAREEAGLPVPQPRKRRSTKRSSSSGKKKKAAASSSR
jgi:hemerythrin-like domain-containing protein